VSVDFIVLGFAPMNGFHIEGVAHDTDDPFFGAEVGQPIPSEEALHGYDEVLAVGSNEP
jgi:hypothetical protein